MHYGDSHNLTLTAGHNEISVEHLITSSIPTFTTSVSQLAAPTDLPTNPAASIISTSQVAVSVVEPAAVTAPPGIDEKAAAISYAAPPGGWGAVSYPPDAGENLASYPAPPGGWGAVSYPPDAGAHLSSYPAPSGGWGGVSYLPDAGANPPPMTTTKASISSSAISSSGSSNYRDSTTSIILSPSGLNFSSSSLSLNVSSTISSLFTSTTTATSTSTIHTTISMTTTIGTGPQTMTPSLLNSPTISTNGSADTNELNDDEL